MTCETCGSNIHTSSICPRRFDKKPLAFIGTVGKATVTEIFEACQTVNLDRELRRARKHKPKKENP